MTDRLEAIAYSPEMFDRIRDFDFGSEPYQRELADWIVQDADNAIGRGTKIWLYVNWADEIVGYGSLGQTNWKYPDASSKRTPVGLIPAVALRREFWGQPKSCPRDDRYSSRIMAELLREAAGWPGRLPAVGLYVHPDNRSAINLYERMNFRRFHSDYPNRSTGITYLGYIRVIIRDGQLHSPSSP